MRSTISCLLLGILLTAMSAAADPLPRVLVLGDSVHRGAARSASTELKGRVEIAFPKINPGDTGTALAQLDVLLGDGKWDLIYFNFGFADLHYRDPDTETIRAMSKHAGGVRVTTAEQYEKNLDELVKRLAATGAGLVWASSTPIVSSKLDNLYDPGSEIEYNALAARVMAKHQVAINDMHAYVVEKVKDKKDPSPFGYNRVSIHQPVVDSILEGLALPKAPREKTD